MTKNTLTSEEVMALENQYGVHSYHPLLVALSKGQGVHAWDMEGECYFDSFSSYSAVNQGHYHPHITKVLMEQAQTLTLTSRVFYNDKLGVYERYVTEYSGSEKALPMSTGAEAVEITIRICHRWAYEQKGVPGSTATTIVCEQNFHGRTTTVVFFSSDRNTRTSSGPYIPGFVSVPYSDLTALEKVLAENTATVVGFLVGPIQGEVGVYVPSEDYLSGAKVLCERYNALFIADKVQTGVARADKCLAADHENAKSDILILGKAISGGVYPVNAVLADDRTMHVIKAGQHGSASGGNPLAAAVTVETLQVVKDGQLAENATRSGEIFHKEPSDHIKNSEVATLVCDEGLLNAVVIDDTEGSNIAWNICLRMYNNGSLAKPTHGNIIRFALPLVMNEIELRGCINIIINTLKESENWSLEVRS